MNKNSHNDYDFDFLNGPAWEAASRLLGCWLVREIDGHELVGKIVETEAYDQTDAASHSYRGRTPRSEVMFGPSGHLYVYFTYGMHYCMNIVCGHDGHGSAALIRAIEPLDGAKSMSHNRGGAIGQNIANGPAKLCQALKIDKALNGHYLQKPPLRLVVQPPINRDNIIQTTRIGISQAQDVPWRFYIKDNPFISKA